jgi:hypothetical protein
LLDDGSDDGQRMGMGEDASDVVAATAWIREMTDSESGGSEPHLFDSANGQYMVKTTTNPQGQRVLVNELVGGLSLDYLGVSHPSPALVDLSKDLLDISPGARYRNGQPLAPGVAFGSSYVQSDPQGSVDVALIRNKEDAAGTAAFDTWVRQHDGRQYRVVSADDEPGKYDFIPVDQGHSFGSPDWTAESLDQDTGIVVAQPIVPIDSALIEPFVDRLESFSEQDAAAIVGQIPTSWATKDEQAALSRYLARRSILAADALRAQYGIVNDPGKEGTTG